MVPTQISCTFFPTGVFSGRFFLASILTAFALLAVAELYEIFKTLVRFLLVFLYFRFILYFGADDPQPNWQPEWHKA